MTQFGMTRSVLVVDDSLVGPSVRRILEDRGCKVAVRSQGGEGISYLTDQSPDLVIVTTHVRDLSTDQIVRRIRARHLHLPILVIAPATAIDQTIRALVGVHVAFLTKPFTSGQLVQAVDEGIYHARNNKSHAWLQRDIERLLGVHDETGGYLFGSAVNDLVDEAARSDRLVLIHGEHGTGREAVARLIHMRSSLRDLPFVVVQCASESIQSGTAPKLSQTDPMALSIKELHDQFDGDMSYSGTIFLAGVCELSLEHQHSLIRFIGKVRERRRGNAAGHDPLLRVIASTSKELNVVVGGLQSGEPLCDLLGEQIIHVRPIRLRRTEIPELLKLMLAEQAHALGKACPRLREQDTAYLYSYDWPGNLREMRNITERIVMFGRFQPHWLDGIEHMVLRQPPQSLSSRPNAEAPFLLPENLEYWPTVDELTTTYIDRVLSMTRGKRAKAARVLGVHPTTLWRKLRSSGR